MKRKKIGIVGILVALTLSLILNSVQGNRIYAEESQNDELIYTGDPFFLDEDTNVITQTDEELMIEEYKGEDFDVSLHRKGDDGSFRLFRSSSDTYGVVEENEQGEKEVLETFDSYEEADEYFKTEQTSQRAMIYRNNRVIKVKNGVVNFRTRNGVTYFTEVATGRAGYTHGAYGADGAYIETSADGTQIKFMLSGVIGWVNASDVQLLNYDSSEVKSVNYYVSKNGAFYHYYTIDVKQPYYHSTIVGPSQDFIEQNKAYYSYDGHYFYTSYTMMIDDYRAGNHNNAVNVNNPYYNYYQFLSHRSQSLFTAADIDRYVATYAKPNSKLSGTGNSFLSNQNEYGTNATLMFGVAVNESAWGMSNIAQTKNNLFGHAAYDSDPNAANGYSSVGMSIRAHARIFLSIGYLDPFDFSARYFGPHLGDKSSGVNVKYASDPYWGEKAAAQSYALEKYVFGSYQKQKYSIGVIEQPGTIVNIRKEATTSSVALYQNKSSKNKGGTGDYPFIILETVIGESVNGNNKWYKIQADPTLNDSRTSVTQDIGYYNFGRDYAYVHSGAVKLLGGGETPVDPPTDPGKKLLGDVNGDNRITAADYVLIKNYIMGKTTLNSDQMIAADVNKDGRVTPADYVLIKNYIMGKIPSLE